MFEEVVALHYLPALIHCRKFDFDSPFWQEMAFEIALDLGLDEIIRDTGAKCPLM